MLLLSCTPLVDQYQPCLGLTVLLGPMVLRCLGRPYGLLSFFSPRGPLGGLSTSSSGTQAACALGKEITFHSLREMTPDR